MTWYAAAIDGGHEIACVGCWSELQADAIDAGTHAESIHADGLRCAYCGWEAT